MAVPYVADGHVGRVLTDVPERYLAAHQTAGQTLRVPVVELQRDDRMRRFDRETGGGRVFCGRKHAQRLKHVLETSTERWTRRKGCRGPDGRPRKNAPQKTRLTLYISGRQVISIGAR